MWDEGSRLYTLRELALTWALPAAAVIIAIRWPWTLLIFVPAFCVFVACQETAKARKLSADREAGRKREAETKKNREIGGRVCELREAGMEYEDIFNRLKAEGRRGPDSE